MPLLIYTLLRVALVVVVYVVLSFIGFRGWLLLIGALLIAALLSFLILPRQADAAAGIIQRRVGSRVGDRLDRSISVDDDVEDAATAPRPAARAATGEDRAPASNGQGFDDEDADAQHPDSRRPDPHPGQP